MRLIRFMRHVILAVRRFLKFRFWTRRKTQLVLQMPCGFFNLIREHAFPGRNIGAAVQKFRPVPNCMDQKSHLVGTFKRWFFQNARHFSQAHEKTTDKLINNGQICRTFSRNWFQLFSHNSKEYNGNRKLKLSTNYQQKSRAYSIAILITFDLFWICRRYLVFGKFLFHKILINDLII